MPHVSPSARSLSSRFRFLSLALLLSAASMLAVSAVADKLPETATKPAGVKSDEAIAAELEQYRNYVTELAAPEMEGRGPGTAGLDKARDYIIAEYEKHGLKPAYLQPSGEGDPTPGFMQEFEITVGAEPVKQSLALVQPDGSRILEGKAADTFSPRGYSGDGEFDGELVFVGYGIKSKEHEYDSYAGLDSAALKGKVAVAYRYEPLNDKGAPKWVENAHPGQWGPASNLIDKAKWAKAHGAAALVVVDPPSMQKEGPLPSTAETQGRPGQSADIPVVQIKPAVFRAMLRAHGEGEQSFARELQEHADKAAFKPITLKNVHIKGEVELEKRKAKVHNVAGYLPGWGKLKDEIIVIGAHYDHLGLGGAASLARGDDRGKELIHHGADDNASGTAAVLMLTRWFHEWENSPSLPARNEDDLGRRTLLFVCFSAEERGLLGSAHMVKHPNETTIDGESGIELSQISAMLNMDMVGRMKDKTLLCVGTGSGDRFDELIKKSAEGLDLKANVQGRSAGGSDHMSFQAKKIPAVHFYTGVHKDYHKPSDTAEKVNVEGAVQTCFLLAGIVQNYWQDATPIKFNTVRMAHPAAGGPRGSGAYLGVLPNYASLEAEDGCAIDGVSDGSPAAQAGLKADDVIVGWNKRTIKNLYDLTAAIRESKAGDEVNVKVKRDGKEIEIKVKLGTR